MTTSHGDTRHSSPDPPKLLCTGLITLPEAGGEEQSPGTAEEQHEETRTCALWGCQIQQTEEEALASKSTAPQATAALP